MLTDSELNEMCDVLIQHEGTVPWMYCDSRGFVTVGVGDKVSCDAAATMPFVDGKGRPVCGEEKRIAWSRVVDSFKPGLDASAYSRVSDLRLPYDFIRRRLALRVREEFAPIVAKHCPQFVMFPTPAKLALVDIAYNVGVRSFGSFVRLIDYCNKLQFTLAAEEVHTKRDGEDPQNLATWGKRNFWRRTMMLQADLQCGIENEVQTR
jgi:GH24 family phage-related lysozyme (muramidase)